MTTTNSTSKTPLAYGSWPSVIHASQLTSQSVRLGEPQITPHASYWIESRPQEQGRCVLMRLAHGNDQTANEVLPPNISVRSKAHEYGGASYLACEAGVFYIDASDQRVYLWTEQAHESEREPTAKALTPAGPYRYADLCFDPHHQRLLAVQEDHTFKQAGTTKQEINQLVAISLGESPSVSVIASGCDFYSNPQVSPNGDYLSWISWNHPHMPWDSSQCWVAPLDQHGHPQPAVLVAGSGAESVFQPQWSPDNQLLLVSDRNDWWNLYRCDVPNLKQPLQPLFPLNAEFATPQWVFGMSTYGFLSDTELLTCYSQNGRWHLATLDTQSLQLNTINTPFTEFSQIQCCEGRALLLASGPLHTPRLLSFDGHELHSIAQSSQQKIAREHISIAQPVSFSTGQGAVAHGFYYPPTHAQCSGPEDQQPPLIVMCHGGPTGATDTGLNLKVQYWTNRGFAVMDVNYRGSTGYGRHYREQLNGAWGLHDVQDACAAVDYLVERSWVDKDKVAIRGSSAGGYTVLAALTFSDHFCAGASLYGIGDLETLATDTHKFEARYLDSLVGPYPQRKALYQQRSPIHHAQQLNCPVIFFQGLEDKVVPPNQAQTMVDELDKKQIPVAYVTFAGEGHGFRGAHAIQRSLEAEWSFYGQVFGFAIDQNIEAVEVKHLHTSEDQY